MAYLSWSFLKMGEKAERSTSFLFLLMAGVPVLFAAVFAFVAGLTAIVYVIYAVLPALPFLFPGGNMAQAGLGNEQSLPAFFLMWISLYAVFAVLAVFLGKARYLRPGGVLLAAGVNLTLMLVYYLFA